MKLKLLSTTILLILLPFVTKAQSQQSELDSLKMALKNAGNDTARMVTLFNLSSYYVESNRDSSTFFGEQSNRLAKKLNQPLWTAQYLLVNAYFSMQQGDYSSAFKLCNQALDIIRDEKNEKNVYIPNDDQFAKDPHKYRLSLIMGVYHQLGNIYSSSGNNEKGIEYFKKEIDLSNSLNSNKGSVESNMNIGQEYANMKKFDSSLIYSRKALNYANVTRDKTYAGYILDRIGYVYSGIALSKLPGLVSLDLSDISKTAHISKPDPKELDDYIKKLKVYNYFLISNLQQEYKFDIEVLTKTLNKLETAYKIGDHKKRLTSTN
jgi:tetratricopeptide (TPR) repeat protein